MKPYQLEAQKYMYVLVYGDETGKSVRKGSSLDTFRQAIGKEIPFIVDFSKMGESFRTGVVPGAFCQAVIDNLTGACSDSYSYKPTMQEVFKAVECRWDGKYDYNNTDPGGDTREKAKAEAQDIEMVDGTFIYHIHPGHVNVDQAIFAALDRELNK